MVVVSPTAGGLRMGLSALGFGTASEDADRTQSGHCGARWDLAGEVLDGRRSCRALAIIADWPLRPNGSFHLWQAWVAGWDGLASHVISPLWGTGAGGRNGWGVTDFAGDCQNRVVQ